MPETAHPVIRHAFATRDFERARDVLAAAYGDHVPTLRGEPDRFVYEASSVEADDLRLEDMYYGSVIESRYRPFEDALLIGTLRHGVCSYDDGEQQRTVASGDLAWFRPDRLQHIRTEEVRFDFARLDMGALGRAAHEMSGIAPEALRFHCGPPVSPERTRFWAATRRWLAEHVLADDGLAGEPLVRADAFRAITRATLLAVPNTALDALADPDAAASGQAEPATVRRAVEFIDANAQRDIDLTQVAEVARIGPRGLQAAFRRYRGETPLEYLRRVRMAGAHGDLQTADPTRGDTVGAIAARWGFRNPGRFAVEYARVHGCSPSETLRH